MSLTFKKSDFDQIAHSIIFINQTSGTQVKDYHLIKIECVSEQGVALEVPTISCNTNHNLLVMFYNGLKPRIPNILPQEGAGKGIIFSAVGKILEKTISEHDKTLSSIKINFSQFDKVSWHKIFQSYRTKQECITSTFDLIKIKLYPEDDTDKEEERNE